MKAIKPSTKEAPQASSSSLPKRTQTGDANKESYDKERFDSKFHAEEFDEIIKRKVFLERLFILKEEDCYIPNYSQMECLEEALEVYEEIQARKWEYYCHLDIPGYEVPITHFYANMNHLDKENPYSTFVFGKKIPFDSNAINSVLKTPFPKGSECTLDKLMQSPIDMDEMLRVLCEPGAKWKMSLDGKEPLYLIKTSFKPLARMWLALVQNLLLPILQKHKVYKKRVLATYCLVTKQPINVGLTIADELLLVRKNNSSSLTYGCLISSLCKKFGAKYAIGFPLNKQTPVNKSFFHSKILERGVNPMNPQAPPPIFHSLHTDEGESSHGKEDIHSMLKVIQENMLSMHIRQESGLELIKEMAWRNNVVVDRALGKRGGFHTMMEETRFLDFSGSIRERQV